MLGKYKPLWGPKPRLKSSYDAVIIGGGLHGLATAYFLARDHGMTDVAVLEKRFIGYGGAGRNTAIVRANQRTQQNVPLYKEDHFSGMRSSALPLSHTTNRKEAVTLLRLARILNFIKSLLDTGTPIPDASPAKIRSDNLDNRIQIGKQLIGKFLNDGRIRGVTPQGDVYDHLISDSVSREFVAGLAQINIRGTI